MNKVLRKLLSQRDNQLCADCGAPDPKWASTNLGVFICIQCSGIHRSLGVHISKVMSVTLDEWTAEQVSLMAEVGGNAAANAIYEAYLPAGFTKPGPNANIEQREDWIVRKYEDQEFVKPALRLNSQASRRSVKSTSSKGHAGSGMVEFLGLLKVRVLKGTNLAVRDFLTSDPYVVLHLGHQTARTKVINSNLNPVWDEEILLSVPSPPVPLKLQVFDYDRLSADDIMGEAVVDLQPIVTAASVHEELDLDEDAEEVQLGRCLATSDNALARDSRIRLADGLIKQDLLLNLKNVESGQLELELEWVPLSQ